MTDEGPAFDVGKVKEIGVKLSKRISQICIENDVASTPPPHGSICLVPGGQSELGSETKVP